MRNKKKIEKQLSGKKNEIIQESNKLSKCIERFHKRKQISHLVQLARARKEGLEKAFDTEKLTISFPLVKQLDKKRHTLQLQDMAKILLSPPNNMPIDLVKKTRLFTVLHRESSDRKECEAALNDLNDAVHFQLTNLVLRHVITACKTTAFLLTLDVNHAEVLAAIFKMQASFLSSVREYVKSNCLAGLIQQEEVEMNHSALKEIFGYYIYIAELLSISNKNFKRVMQLEDDFFSLGKKHKYPIGLLFPYISIKFRISVCEKKYKETEEPSEEIQNAQRNLTEKHDDFINFVNNPEQPFSDNLELIESFGRTASQLTNKLSNACRVMEESLAKQLIRITPAQGALCRRFSVL